MAPNVNLQRRKRQRDAKRDIEKLRKELLKQEKQQKKQQESEQKKQQNREQENRELKKQQNRELKKQQNKERSASLAKERCKRYYENKKQKKMATQAAYLQLNGGNSRQFSMQQYFRETKEITSNKEKPRSFEKQKRIASNKEKSRNKRVTRTPQGRVVEADFPIVGVGCHSFLLDQLPQAKKILSQIPNLVLIEKCEVSCGEKSHFLLRDAFITVQLSKQHISTGVNWEQTL
ncbi:hypothetical protein AVEN_250045-1 [Araneus ventricosus]|uniref:Uncharacterized protein n=1 Tax=Araneus ventricosus TaxID=182803 RepID=A0A4Y2QB92_ARAVE|nr:hypothetical protein AVEN_250045-1 [Araneus ventricosus]